MSIPSLLLVLGLSSLSFLLGAWLITGLFRLSAAWQHLWWLLALVMPVLSIIIVSGEMNVKVPILPAGEPIELPVSDTPLPVEEVPIAQTLVAANVTESAQSGPIISLELIAGAIWTLGGVVVLFSLSVSHFRISRSLRHSRRSVVPERILSIFGKSRLQSGVQAEVLVCDFSAIPFCYGVLRPRIVFPQAAAEWSDETIRACLAHEFAHLKRGDLLSLTLAQCACAMVWFNPLAWFGLTRLRVAAESAADDLAIEQPGVFPTYASQLIAVAALAKGGVFAPTTFPMARVGQLRQRIDALIDENRRRKPPGLWSAVILSGALAAVFAASLTVELVAAEPAQNGSVVENKGASLPPIKVACDGDFRTENGLVIATGNVRLQWRALHAQADRLEYDKSSGVLRLLSKADPVRPHETLFFLTMRDGDSDSSVSPAIERQADLERMNPSKASPAGSIAGSVQIEGDDNGKLEEGTGIVTKNAMLSQGDVTIGADRVEYQPGSRRANLWEEPSGESHRLIATLDVMDINQAAYDLVKKFIVAIKEGDERILRQLFGADLLSNLSEDRRQEIENVWIQDALKSRQALSKPQDAYTITTLPWSRAGVRVGSPLYWPATPSYYVQIRGPGVEIGMAVCEFSPNRMAIIHPLSMESDPPGASGFSILPEGFPDPRLSNPPVLSKAAPSRGEIAVTVNNVPITKAQVKALVDSIPKSENANPHTPSDELWRSSLDGLIDRLLIFQEWDRLKEKGANIPPYVIEDRVNRIVQAEFHGDRDKFLEAITKNGYTLDSFTEYETLKIIIQAVTQSQVAKMFKGEAATSSEQMAQQRHRWLESLREKARIEYPGEVGS